MLFNGKSSRSGNPGITNKEDIVKRNWSARDISHIARAAQGSCLTAMEDRIHSELIMKEEQDEDESKESRCSTESEKSVTPDGSAIGIRPKPLICKPENVSIGCKSEPIETKWHWAPGAWQDATRTSAFQPYKVLLSQSSPWTSRDVGVDLKNRGIHPRHRIHCNTSPVGHGMFVLYIYEYKIYLVYL